MLVNASPEILAQAGLEQASYCSRETPQVLLARRVTAADLKTMEIDTSNPQDVTPLGLVILKGNFDESECNKHFVSTDTGSKYLCYIFDLQRGLSSATIFSKDGSFFKKALNDPTLPDTPTDSATNVLPVSTPSGTFQVYTTTAAKPGVTLTPTPIPTPDSKHPGSRGMAAIKPSKVLSAADIAANTPAFTEADVAAYLAQPHPEWALIGSIAPIVVDKVEFIPYKLVDNKLNLHLGLRSDLTYDTVVCLVTAHGTFTNLAASNAPMLTPSPGYTPKSPGTFKRAYWVFDIQDGSLKMLGGY
jgi:hypothetical protein